MAATQDEVALALNWISFKWEFFMSDTKEIMEAQVVELEEVVAFQACCASNIDWEAGCGVNQEGWECSGKASGSCC